MTCIIGYAKDGRVYMGGDSAGVAGLDVTIRKDTKVFKVQKRFLIGYTSSFRMGQILRFKLKVTKQSKGQEDYGYMCTTFIDAVRKVLKDEGYTRISSNEESVGTFLVGYNGRLYGVASDLQVAEGLDTYDTCGCGGKYASGAMEILTTQRLDEDPKEKIRKALEVAVKFSGGVRPPFNIEVL
jgi:ATP-dependent protease HslVU (ClpYQ) peptidase subunit